MMKLAIKTGDEVIVIAGKHKGKKGKIVQTFPQLTRVVVEGVSSSKRHLKSRRSQDKGQIVEFSMPIHASNVQLVSVDGSSLRHHKRPKT